MIPRFLLRPLFAAALALGLASAARAQFEMRGTSQNRLYQSNTLAGLSLTAGGSGYTSAPTVTITGGSGSGATATAIVNAGVVTGFTITNPGTGYTSTNPPTVTITGVGTGASAVPVFRSLPDGINPAVTTPQFASVAANTAGTAALSTDSTLSARFPSQIYLIAGTSTPSGTALVLMRSAVGGSFAAGGRLAARRRQRHPLLLLQPARRARLRQTERPRHRHLGDPCPGRTQR